MESAILTLLRYSGRTHSTLGLWFDQFRRLVCFTLEDEHRKVKVPGQTCFPAGRYRLKKWDHPDSKFNKRAAELFPEIHRGFVVEISGVPDFTATLVHWGCFDGDTRGCVLVGDRAWQNVTERGRIAASRKAYRRWYPPVAALLEAEEETGREVWLDVIDYDDPMWM